MSGDRSRTELEQAEPASEPMIPGEPAPATPGDALAVVTLAGDPPAPVAPGDAPATAARKVMWVHVARLLDRDVLVRDPDHVDDLRKYRVATRRLRSALRLLGFALPAGPAERLHRGLGELADAVGAVRDTDVRIEAALAWEAGADAGSGALAPLVASWRSDRTKAYERLLRRLATKRHQRLLERLVAFVDEPAGATPGTDDRAVGSIRDGTASRIWAAYEPIRAQEDAIRSADLATLHRLRIRTKRLRYLLEFLADILGGESPELVAHLTILQDHLGAINDTALTIDAVRAFQGRRADSHETEHAAALSAYMADRERELVRLRASLGGAWRPVVALSFARRLGRTVVIA